MNKGLISVLSTLAGAGAGAAVVNKVQGEKMNNWHQMSDKHLELFLMMNQWVRLKQDGKNLKDYFEKNNYKSIAIYGMSYAGETLINELKGSGICVKYGIDKNADNLFVDVDMVTMEDELQEVDAVVVTAITYFDEIAEMLEKRFGCPILSLEDILFEV